MTEKKTYWLCFKGAGENPPWWTLFMKAGFEHCLILTQENESWLIVDPTRRKLTTLLVYCNPMYNLPHNLRTMTGLKVVKVIMTHTSNNFIPTPFTFVSCVTIVKYMLGLKIRCHTPWQLYRRLKYLCTTLDGRSALGIESIDFMC